MTKREGRQEREVRVVLMTTLCSLSTFADQPTLTLSGTVFRPKFTGWWKMCLDITSIWSMRVFRTKITIENDERYQLDATILFIIINISTCFGHLYAHLQEYRLYTTAYGVQHCKRELCVSGLFHFTLFILLCNCWLRLCCVLYWVPVLHNTCYAHWSGWKCRSGAGACSIWLP